jgi:hypothetical protein
VKLSDAPIAIPCSKTDGALLLEDLLDGISIRPAPQDNTVQLAMGDRPNRDRNVVWGSRRIHG